MMGGKGKSTLGRIGEWEGSHQRHDSGGKMVEASLRRRGGWRLKVRLDLEERP